MLRELTDCTTHKHKQRQSNAQTIPSVLSPSLFVHAYFYGNTSSIMGYDSF